jgi:hypothetical protein
VPDLNDLHADWSNRIARLQAALLSLSQTYAGRIESQMKANRPWEDRTSNARNRLFARAALEPTTNPRTFTVDLVAGHGMEYGIWLELGTRFMRNGSVVPSTGLIGYPIVAPTLRALAPQFVADARQLLGVV